ncbi:molybdopterin-dependent oxidoreductase [Desulfobulbus oligotrophicus]|jgi:thiosulfate reductase/polysulfide reductase chain A|uniref:Molybdopterin-dependent oxidoreductase n=1 Tax=Desulfobulbus oligotrophicus TaxID=1909699 RepID=A0A7T6AQV4_9BACT|nr:molybdopterin-dependent oxidoreductase [Desulfobulbus oligotrophicus]MDY0391658.1 molybdopterin-dependent oxidoreductase [Desulfobulbus oligotrophicus]QQG66126.1 molybdopterin-dependent oxidoreductase [Desulfobulbus oligotrophicus]
MKETQYSICGMCAVRCPVTVHVEDGKPVWIEGNNNDAAMGRSLCAKGGASFAQRLDKQRPAAPLVRMGQRGEGQWREVSWDEAYDYITTRLKAVIAEHGERSIMFSDRGGPFADLRKAFVKALGSPNYHNHDCTCGRSVHHASQSVYGLGRKGFNYDYENARHIVLFGRNITESLRVKEVKSFLKGIKNGAKVTYIDPRASVTASKATRFWQNRPGTDYALLLGIAHCVVYNNYYDEEFVEQYVTGLPELKTFLAPYTPEWAAQESGISAAEIEAFCQELKKDRPKVIIHPGWNLARYGDSFYASRMIHILNALMGSIEQPGGLFYVKGPKDAGKTGLKSLGALSPAVTEDRADGCGTRFPLWDKGAGMLHLTYEAIDTDVPYPVKAYFVHRHNPFIALPDTREQKRILDKLDLIVAVDINFSETAWFADVILPESTYLERASILRTEKGLKPGFGRRQQCVQPLNNTKAGWEIYSDLAKRMGKGDSFPFESIEDIWQYQLQDTGLTAADFDEKGFVKLTDKAIWYDRANLKFGTDSGKIEIINSKWEAAGIVSLAPYVSPETPPAGSFRLLAGRSGYQAHGHHHNNPILHEFLDQNKLWINTQSAAELGIKDGDQVRVAAGDIEGVIVAYVTDLIHPEAVFMLHGFGTDVPAKKRSFGKGLADQIFMIGKLKAWDKAGGGVNLAEAFVKVTPV